jgi:hypothetical protein
MNRFVIYPKGSIVINISFERWEKMSLMIKNGGLENAMM